MSAPTAEPPGKRPSLPRQYTDCLSAVVLPDQPVPRRQWRELWLITIGHGPTPWYPVTFYLLLPAGVALVGFGNSLWHPTAIPTLGRRYPERKGLALSIHGMGGNVGDAVAPLLVGAALGFLTWREVVVLNVV